MDIPNTKIFSVYIWRIHKQVRNTQKTKMYHTQLTKSITDVCLIP